MLTGDTKEPIREEDLPAVRDILYFSVPVVSTTLASFDRLFAEPDGVPVGIGPAHAMAHACGDVDPVSGAQLALTVALRWPGQGGSSLMGRRVPRPSRATSQHAGR